MADNTDRNHESAEEVTARNVAQARELLARKGQQDEDRGAEPPLEDDPHIAGPENPLAQDPTGSRGSTGGIRNMGGGRS